MGPTRTRCRVVAIATLVAAVTNGAPATGTRRRVVDLAIGPFRIKAKRDREVCQAVRVRGVPGMEVIASAIRSRASRNGAVGTHHFVAYGYPGADSRGFPPGLADDPGCNGFGPSDFYTTLAAPFRTSKWTVTGPASAPAA